MPDKSGNASFTLDLGDLKIDKLDKKMKKNLGDYLQRSKDRLVKYMKNNAKWQDITGNARSGLTGHVEKENDMFRIVLNHSVYYGIYLEKRFEQRFAILEPTVRLKGPDVLKGLEEVFRSELYR